jgi:hypothetical protein
LGSMCWEPEPRSVQGKQLRWKETQTHFWYKRRRSAHRIHPKNWSKHYDEAVKMFNCEGPTTECHGYLWSFATRCALTARGSHFALALREAPTGLYSWEKNSGFPGWNLNLWDLILDWKWLFKLPLLIWKDCPFRIR